MWKRIGMRGGARRPAWYRRGQIASLTRSLAEKPAVTDFVFWAREPL
jgi:hypothetical protein